jgi:hypothetical protein
MDVKIKTGNDLIKEKDNMLGKLRQNLQVVEEDYMMIGKRVRKCKTGTCNRSNDSEWT